MNTQSFLTTRPQALAATTAQVRRRRIEQRHGKFAWYYVYDVQDDQTGESITYGAPTLAFALGMARRAGYRDIIRMWDHAGGCK